MDALGRGRRTGQTHHPLLLTVINKHHAARRTPHATCCTHHHTPRTIRARTRPYSNGQHAPSGSDIAEVVQSTFCSNVATGERHWARQINLSGHEGGIPAILNNTGRTMSWNGPPPVTPTVWLRPNLEPRQRQSWTCRRPSPVISLPVPSGQARPAIVFEHSTRTASLY
ncbi:hypothetical protein BDP81DRAFT_58726 [Colletotrichum phormii]|uniref:Uncharacterized protein n=1 Tax=Colletotrichum phormii TaxID=359342 RepID=A0AAI9ZLY8_9PEZI|nr:uncharacterized protein BDP81DRAFT_58726 [Colletotrichum phormii]KAK1634408.1 hypothetical protein BDP81DRAFT_58726 [Colletotrichum phormii]